MSRQFCYVWLSASEEDSKKIASSLLNQRLIACAKFMPTESMYWWQDKVVSDHEVVLIMETAEDLFEAIEAEVTKLHSYDTFVLQAVPVRRINQKAADWMSRELKE